MIAAHPDEAVYFDAIFETCVLGIFVIEYIEIQNLHNYTKE